MVDRKIKMSKVLGICFLAVIFGLQLLGIIPEDLSVVEAVVHGKPIVNAKNAPAAQAFGRVAARFEGENVPLLHFHN